MSKITMVASGKGGVGKSTVCAMLGTALARSGKKVLIVELDMGLRCLDIILGISNRTVYDLSDVISGRCTPKDAVVRCDACENLYVTVSPNDPSFDFDNQQFSDFLKKLYGVFDYVFIDTPAGMGRQMEAAAALCDSALIVATPDPVCVRDGSKTADKLSQLGVKDMRLIINRVNTQDPKGNSICNFDEIIDAVCVQLIGVVPDDRDAALALSQGETVSAKTVFSAAFDNIAKRFSGIETSLLII